jgi:Skp family chaperone for outer membrane proteins
MKPNTSDMYSPQEMMAFFQGAYAYQASGYGFSDLLSGLTTFSSIRRMPPDADRKREDELFVKEKELRDLQKKRFGYEGDLFKERQKLVKPIQDKVYNAVQKMAAARAYDFILDKSEGITIIFADPKLDKSDDVLKELGINK